MVAVDGGVTPCWVRCQWLLIGPASKTWVSSSNRICFTASARDVGVALGLVWVSVFLVRVLRGRLVGIGLGGC